MNILILTDIHGKTAFIDRVSSLAARFDLIVIAGDVTYFKPLGFSVEILRRIGAKTGKTVFFIPGNCDDPNLLDYSEDNLLNIHRKLVEHRGFLFYGIGGSNKTPFNTWIEWGENDIEKFLKDLDRSNVDYRRLIMVTHSPPYGVMDDVNGLNVGSKALREFLNNRNPLLWITGHIHEYSNWVKIGGTTVVNPGPFMRGYYGLLTIKQNEVQVVLGNVKEL